MKQQEQKYNIICLSNQLWDFPNWTNKRHVMARLAKKGNNVIYVDPPINLGFLLLRQIFRGFWNIKRLLTQQKKESFDSPLIFTPVNIFPNAKITTKYHIFNINRIAKKYFNPNLKTILWIYHVQIPELTEILSKLRYDVLIYDCVDNYIAFPESSTFYSATLSKKKLIEQEKHLTSTADIVFASAPGLVDRLKQYNSNVIFTPNVGDYARFKDVKKYVSEVPEDLKQISRPRIGYIGALDEYKLDLNLVKKIANDHPSYSFIYIGQLGLKDADGNKTYNEILNLPNVYFLGTRPYQEKHKYMAGFDVDHIPYVLNDYTVGGCFPVKFHDSLAAGLPVVVTDMPAYLPFKDVCYISKTYDEFSQNIKKALNEDNPQKIKERQTIAKDNNWDGKVSKMLSAIDMFLNK